MAERIWRLWWLMFLVGQAMLAAAWWWLSPAGFPVNHPRFWLNGVGAPLGLAVAVLGLWALHREKATALRLILPGSAAAWAGSAVTFRMIFPTTMRWLWLAPAGLAAMLALAAMRPWRHDPVGRGGWAGLAAVVLATAIAGALATAAVRPPPGDTHPLDTPMTSLSDAQSENERIASGTIRLGKGSLVQTSDGSLMMRVAPLVITVQPLLTFLSGSPDGAPTVLVPAGARAGPEPRLRTGWKTGEQAYQLEYDFPGQGSARLDARIGPTGDSIVLEAAARLDRRMFSHLNSYCDVEVRGQHRLALEFSPCPGQLIEVRHFDYPFGKPARFAFVEADRTFRVVEATSGEKGPFHTLARGQLARDEALTITMHDQGRAVVRLTLDDFAGHADTTLSPTAGWGAPVNAIEFSLAVDASRAPASIFLTLAGTSVGRGWDCVPHAAGTYRNRLRVESIGAGGTSRPDLR